MLRRYTWRLMDSQSPTFSGGSGNRTGLLVVLSALAISAIAWLAWRGADLRTGQPEPTAAHSVTQESTAAETATPAPAAPADAAAIAELEAPAVAAILAAATAAAPAAAALPADPADDPLAPVRAIEADGYVDAARQVYRDLSTSPGATGLAASVALARLALAEDDPATAFGILDSAAARAAGKAIAVPAALPPTKSPAPTDGSSPVNPGAATNATAAAADDRAADRPFAMPTSMQPLPETLDALAAYPAGLYLYGLALEELGRHRDAAEAFTRYGAAVPAMADVAAMAAGNTRFALGDYTAALEAFTRARDAAVDPTTATASLAALRRGNALLQLGPPGAAIAAYREAWERADSDSARSQALAGTIAAELDAGNDAAARAARLRLVRELPDTPLALAAMEKLRAAEIPVTPAEEAAVRAGNGDHAAALGLLTVAIAADPQHPSQWRLDVIRWYSAAGEHAQVVETADTFLAARPEDPLAPEAAWERARAFARLGQDRDATAAYGELADRWPASDRAPEALWQRAWLILALDGPSPATEAFQDLAVRYPADENARDARFRAGLSAWRTGNLPRAAELWSAVSDNSEGLDHARAEYWLGRSAADGGATDIAATHWRAAAAADPTGYYGLRAAERLGQPAAEAPGNRGSNAANDNTNTREGDADYDRSVAQWMATWKPEVSAAGLAQTRVLLAQQPEVQRAAAWLAIGDRHAALRTLRGVNSRAWGDPVTQAVLARHAARLGLHEIATSAAGGAIGAAPPGQRLAAPAVLGRLAYPDAFGDLVRAEAEERDVPLALLFALIRQESRFEPTARSGAGATGLTQVMPATGEGLAGALGEADFAVGKLYRPYYALRFGTFLIGRHIEQYDGQPFPALAAYNAGGGNAARWWDAADGDPDLFAEIIDFRETRLYVRLVAEHAAHYRRLYAEMR
jgi:soluble lytic murein transglycosylase